MNIIFVLLGIALLIAGRRLFWLFVGALGFIVGFALATQFFASQSELVILAISLGVGLLGALLAVFLQQLAIGVAGFVAGGYGLLLLLDVIGLRLGIPTWIPFVVGGIIGAALLASLFDWALIVLSSLTGAGLVLEAIKAEAWLGIVIFAILFFIGLGIQAAGLRGKKPKSE